MGDTDGAINSGINDSGISKRIPLDLYVLWRSQDHAKFTIQARFNPEAKFYFQQVARLSDGKVQDQSPCVYRLQLDFSKDTNGKLVINREKTVYLAQEYRLRISHPGQLFNSHYEDNFSRVVRNTDDAHCFLFDVNFQGSPPGTFLLTQKIFQLVFIRT